MVWDRATAHGTVPTPLTNFTTRIREQISHDDGEEQRTVFEIEARLRDRTHQFSVPAERFVSMNWPVEHLGAAAIVYPGTTVKDHARAAIQILSGDPPRRVVYTHTGWRKIAGQWCYLHAGGGLGASGPVSGVEVDLPPALEALRLPDPPAGGELREAVRASLKVRSVAPPRVTWPLLASAFRAALGPSDFADHVVGPTGAGKTELATLAQQHFGSGFDAQHLPGSWSSTGNSLEVLAFHAKDTLIVVDDFAPSGAPQDVARFHREADRYLRAQGNVSGRGRLAPDGTLRPIRRPRGLTVSTGEDVPRGQSLRARIFTLHVGPQDVDWSRLTEAQAAGREGLYARAMAGYVQWLAGRYGRLRGEIRETVEAMRRGLQGRSHRRTSTIEANLLLGVELFLEFAAEVGAVGEQERGRLREESAAAIAEAAAAQEEHQRAAEPTRRFLELLRSALASGDAHVASVDGGPPDNPRAWGWRSRGVVLAGEEPVQCEPMGKRVGWTAGEEVYLDKDAAHRAAQAASGQAGEGLAIGSQTLVRRLKEQGLLASLDPDGKHLEPRVVVEGVRRRVLHLKRATVLPSIQVPEPAQEGLLL
ncbi:MAG: hypothetical protein A2Z17_00550 [Gammaproteobacteria bacterium RBG_16_66_13]|nr:MAG: hypothetical protein A2Z17_00550 [Gammaproteobacteria bacterium RBG_16_66_13]